MAEHAPTNITRTNQCIIGTGPLTVLELLPLERAPPPAVAETVEFDGWSERAPAVRCAAECVESLERSIAVRPLVDEALDAVAVPADLASLPSFPAEAAGGGDGDADGSVPSIGGSAEAGTLSQPGQLCSEM